MAEQEKTSNEDYKFIKVIGTGSYGQVWLATNVHDRKKYVLKKIKIANVPAKERQSAEQECQLLSTLKHPNIVPYKDSFISAGHLYIAMGYCESGDLYGRLKQQLGVALDERQVVEWFVQIAMALQYLHERNILHRDLKTQNIFLTKSKIIKIGDLGIARVLSNSNDMATTLIGTPYYMSPELFGNKPYNHKSDIWALGCCVYEMATLKHAFNARDFNSLSYKILKGRIPDMPKHYSPELLDLIRAMLHTNPSARPSVSRILRERYIRSHIQIFLEGTKAKSNRTPSGRREAPPPSPPRPPVQSTPPVLNNDLEEPVRVEPSRPRSMNASPAPVQERKAVSRTELEQKVEEVVKHSKEESTPARPKQQEVCVPLPILARGVPVVAVGLAENADDNNIEDYHDGERERPLSCNSEARRRRRERKQRPLPGLRQLGIQSEGCEHVRNIVLVQRHRRSGSDQGPVLHEEEEEMPPKESRERTPRLPGNGQARQPQRYSQGARPRYSSDSKDDEENRPDPPMLLPNLYRVESAGDNRAEDSDDKDIVLSKNGKKKSGVRNSSSDEMEIKNVIHCMNATLNSKAPRTHSDSRDSNPSSRRGSEDYDIGPVERKEETIGRTTHFNNRMVDLRRDVVRALGVERMAQAYEILEQEIDSEEFEPKLKALLQEKYEAYASKIWQLKVWEDNNFGH